MKPLLIASLLALSSASVAFARCKNGRCRAGCRKDGNCDYVKVISRNDPYVFFLYDTSNGLFKAKADCQQYKLMYLEVNNQPLDGRWTQMMPRSMGESSVRLACAGGY